LHRGHFSDHTKKNGCLEATGVVRRRFDSATGVVSATIRTNHHEDFGFSMSTNPPTILHVDMDAFYASVEQRDHPELRGRPVMVGGLTGRGVVCAASYEARLFGLHSAMPMAAARRLCPQGVFRPVRMQHYAGISRQIRAILMSFTPLVEPLSLDEAFLDVRGCESNAGPAPEIGRQIKSRIKAETGLVASVGVAANKFLAKLACDHGKPDGFVVLPPEQVAGFLAPLPVSRIWGVGAKGEQRLYGLGIRTIGELAALPENWLTDRFGAVGRYIWRLAHGRDDRTVIPDRQAKSISTETTFANDIADRDVLRIWLRDLVDQLAFRLRQQQVRARTVEIKIRSSDFHTQVRRQALREATNRTEALWHSAQSLFARSLSRDLLPVRLLGVGATRLIGEGAVQGELFDGAERQQQESLDRAVDAIRSQFGADAIRRGSRLDRREEGKG
jgi:DNA polymerase-4